MLKKFVASLLTAAMLISVVSVAIFNVGAAIDLQYSATYNDDFSDALKTAQYFEQTRFSGTSDTLPSNSTSFTVEDGVLTPAHTNSYK